MLYLILDDYIGTQWHQSVIFLNPLSLELKSGNVHGIYLFKWVSHKIKGIDCIAVNPFDTP